MFIAESKAELKYFTQFHFSQIKHPTIDNLINEQIMYEILFISRIIYNVNLLLLNTQPQLI